jgi:hypothetical protein
MSLPLVGGAGSVPYTDYSNDHIGGSMSVTKTQMTTSAVTARRKAVFHKAIEQLEDRRMMSATLTLVNPDLLPGSNRLIFNYIQNPDTSVPNTVHDEQALQITDTGTSPLVISSMSLSGPWSFVGAPVGGYTNVTVNPGTPLNVELLFTQRSLPAHTTNETNFTSQPNGGAYIGGSLTIISNDATTPTNTVTLAGYWQNQSANEEEPSLQSIVNGVAGYDTVIATPSQLSTESNGVDLQNNGTTPTYYGQEVVSSAWQAANPSEPVSIQELAEYYIEGVSDTTYWYSASTLSSHPLMTSAADEGQTVLPTMSNGQPMTASFTPGGTFGFRDDNLYSDDAINTANGDTVDDGHRFRFYPLIDSNGSAVPNAWIVAVHEGTALSDYQDAVYVVTNMEPAPVSTTPPAPTSLTATNAADPVLSWTGVTYTDLAGYNVYRSTSSTGTYTKLTTSPISTTTFTDTTAPVGATVFYRVTAVDSTSGNESAPATASAVTPGGSVSTTGPTAGSFSVSAFTNQAVVISVLPHVTDTTGTPTASSLLITSGPTHGSATVDTTNGLITYTSNSNFVGAETITYSINDSNSAGPSTGTITINVVSPATTAPITSPQFGATLANTPVVLTPVALNSSGATITPALVEVATTSTTFTTTAPQTLTTTGGGTITLNSNFTVTYTPAVNFVGSDSFQFKVQDSNGNLSTAATYTINVGVQIASTKGSNKSVVYPDAGGQQVTVSLSKGVADVYFAGTGTETAAKGKVTITGSHLTISDIAASQTTTASSLSLTTSHNKGSITVGGITDTGTLGTIVARSTNLTGVTGSPTVVLGGVRAIYLESINSADIQLGGTGVTSVSLIAGAVTNSFLTSAVTVNSLNVKSWSNSTSNLTAESISAPVIRSLVVTGEFDPDLNLTSTGRDLYGAIIRGTANKGLWTLDGSAGAIFVGSVGSAWGGITATGALSSVRVNTGGLPADITASTITSLSVAGTLSGDITTTGNLRSLRAGQLIGSTVNVGSSSNTLIAPTASNIGTATLGSLVLTSHAANTFSDSNIVADVIDSVVTGPINTAGTTEGISGATIKSLTLNLGSGNVHIPAKDLLSNSALSTYLLSKDLTLGNFAIDIV